MKQSKKKKTRGAITAKLVANMLGVAGVDHIITLDLHSSQMQGFFSKPVDNLLAEPAFSQYIRNSFENFESEFQMGCIVCKNAGGTKRCVYLAIILRFFFFFFRYMEFSNQMRLYKC